MAEGNPTGALRLFIAITLPEAVRQAVLRVQSQLQPLVPGGAARWSRPDQFHLTLCFLGSVPMEQVDPLQAAAAAVCRSGNFLKLRAAGLGFFPHARAPRVLWVGIDDPDLAALQRRLADAVRPFTAESTGEKFVGHLTLARLGWERFNPRKLANAVQAQSDRCFGEWTAEEIELVRSELSAAGARHTPLTIFPLGGH